MLKRRMTIWGISLFVFLFDQLTKQLIQKEMLLGESQRVLGELIRLTYIRNPNAVFGISLGKGWVFLIFSFLAIAAIIYFYLKLKRQTSFIFLVGLSLIFGGAIGNFCDRLFFGEVVDFIDVGIGHHRWPIFNVADSAVTIGIILIFWENFRK